MRRLLRRSRDLIGSCATVMAAKCFAFTPLPEGFRFDYEREGK